MWPFCRSVWRWPAILSDATSSVRSDCNGDRYRLGKVPDAWCSCATAPLGSRPSPWPPSGTSSRHMPCRPKPSSPGWRLGQTFRQQQRRRQLVCLARHQHEVHELAARIADANDFAAKSAPGTAPSPVIAALRHRHPALVRATGGPAAPVSRRLTGQRFPPGPTKLGRVKEMLPVVFATLVSMACPPRARAGSAPYG